MKRQRSFVGVSLLSMLLCCGVPLAQSALPGTGAGGTSPLGELPLIFVENAGQWDGAARFVARKGPLTARFEAGAMVLALRGASEGEVVRLAFEGASSGVWIEGEDPLPGVHNFFVGERSHWRTDVPGYASIVYHELREGVDLRLRDRNGRLEYDLLLERAADLAEVVVRCEGVQCLEIDAEGNLVLTTALGELTQAPPVTWQVLPGGAERPVECRYRRIGAERYGFEAVEPEPDLPLVVDPGLEWSTFLGGSGEDLVRNVIIAPDGNVIACGYTDSLNFPVEPDPGAFLTTLAGGYDGFIVRMDPEESGAAQLEYATYLGGTANDFANTVSVDAKGVLTVVGGTLSTDFPTTSGAYQTVHGGAGTNDVFVCRLDPSKTGSQQLLYSTFVGGSAVDGPDDHHVDAGGIVTVVGRTESTNFPTTPGVFGPTHNGGRDIFVCRLDPSKGVPAAQLRYSTYLGGSGTDHNNAYDHLVVTDQGQIIVAGRTDSPNFPVKPNPGAYQTALRGGIDGFVCHIDPAQVGADQLVASTYLGGSLDESLHAVSLDAAGVVTVAGWTYSADYPTTGGSYQPVHASAGPGYRDCFITRLDPGLTTLVASTFLGGSGWEYIHGLEAEGSGLVTVVGTTVSDTFPTTPGAYQTVKPGFGEAFVCRLDPGLTQLHYSTFLGGSTAENGLALAVDPELAAVVGGRTLSGNFPSTPGAFDTTFTVGNYDGYLAKLDMMPTGAQPYGASTPGCAGPIAIGVDEMPRTGALGFELLCVNAPANGAGVMAVSLGKLDPPFHILGVNAWIHPLQLVLEWVVSADSAGYCTVPVPIGPGVTPGLQVYAQFFWLPDACAPQGIASSNALELTIQP